MKKVTLYLIALFLIYGCKGNLLEKKRDSMYNAHTYYYNRAMQEFDSCLTYHTNKALFNKHKVAYYRYGDKMKVTSKRIDTITILINAQ